MDKVLRSLLSNVWRRMIRNICYRASNPSMHCAWLEASFEPCNTVVVVAPVVVKKRVVPVPPQAPRATPRPPGRPPRAETIPGRHFCQCSRVSALPQEKVPFRVPLTRSDTTPAPSSPYSRESSTVSSASSSRASTRNRSSLPTSLSPPSTRSRSRSVLPTVSQMSPSPTNVTLTRTLCSTIPS